MQARRRLESEGSNHPKVGFLLEQTLGHVTHADNLRRIIPTLGQIEARFADVEYEVTGLAAKVPFYNSNWTVRAGVRSRRKLRELVRGDGVQALFVHSQVPATLAGRWLTRVPSIVSLDATPLQYDELGEYYAHERGGERVEQLKWRLHRSCFRKAAHIVSWSDWTRQSLIENYDVSADKISVIAPGVDVARWARPIGSGEASDNTVRILFVGGDLQRKGGSLLIEATRVVRELVADRPHLAIELHFVTNADIEDEQGVFVHRGFRPNTPELIALYHRCDVFCLPTLGDCLPMVLSEAAAAGLPMISTAVGAIPEIVRDGETGLLVKPGDLQSLVAALERLITDPQLRNRLAGGASALVATRFDARKNAGAIVQLLHDLAVRGATAGALR